MRLGRFLPNAIGEGFRREQLQVLTLFATATVVFLIGLIDDLRGLPARFKLVVRVLGAMLLCLAGVRIGSINLGGGIAIVLAGWPARSPFYGSSESRMPST